MQQISASVNRFDDIPVYILNQVVKYPAPKIFPTNQNNKWSIKTFEKTREQLLEL